MFHKILKRFGILSGFFIISIILILQFTSPETIYHVFVEHAEAESISSLQGYTGKIGQEDISFGTGLDTDTFTVPTYSGSTITLTKLPNFAANAYSIIKGQWYVSASASITDHGAGSGGNYTAGNLKFIIDTCGSNYHTIVLPGDTDYPFLTNLTVPANIVLDIKNGALLSPTSGVTLTLPLANIIAQPSQQIFDNDGTISFSGESNFAYVNWFENNETPGTTDMTSALQKAINAVGNKATIMITTQIYLTDEITLPSGGGTIIGSTSDGFNVDAGRNRFHIKNGIGADDSKSLFWAPALSGKCTWDFENLNIDMNGSTSTGFQNEEDHSIFSPRFTLRKIHLYNCGKNGVVINYGGNSSKIQNCVIDGPSGYLSGAEFNSDFVSLNPPFLNGSSGITILASDGRVEGTEVKGGFEYGLYIASVEAIVSNNYFEQCHYGCYVYYGGYSRFTGNRFHLNVRAGVKVYYGSPIFVGNTARNNNSIRTATTGSFDGVGFDLTHAYNAIFSGNSVGADLYGFNFTYVNFCYFIGNVGYDNDGEFYHYSTNDTSDLSNIGMDIENGFFQLFNNTMSGRMKGHALGGVGWSIDGRVMFNDGVAVKNYYSALTGDLALNPEDGTYIKLIPAADGWAVTLDTGYTSSFTGTYLVVENSSPDYTFTFEDEIIYPQTIRYFIVQGVQQAKSTKEKTYFNETSLTGDITVSPKDGYFLKVTPDTNGHAITLADYTSGYRGCDIIVENTDPTYTFTFEGVTIPVSKTYEFIVSSENVAHRIE